MIEKNLLNNIINVCIMWSDEYFNTLIGINGDDIRLFRVFRMISSKIIQKISYTKIEKCKKV